VAAAEIDLESIEILPLEENETPVSKWFWKINIDLATLHLFETNHNEVELGSSVLV
jgi:hypothetical protein